MPSRIGHKDEMSSDSDCIYHCPYPGCGYETNRAAHLKRHERTHTKERPYKCPFCHYCASRSDHLRRHYKIHGKLLSSLNRASMIHTVQYVQQTAQSKPTCIPTKAIDQGTAIFLQFIHKVRGETVSCF